MKRGFPTDDDQKLCQEKMIKELVNGKESAAQLQNLLMLQINSGDGGGDGAPAEELAVKILNSFTQTLSMVMTSSSFSGTSNSNQIISVANNNDDQTNNNILSLHNTTKNKKRRGCYRRRNATETGIQVSATVEDGYAWRKYGQKDIHNSDYPRCYYRCTHKYDQGCKATKQVQKIAQEDSHPYQITYFGHHTCNKDTSSSRAAAPEIISEVVPVDSCLFSFESKVTKLDTFSSTTIINQTAAAATSTQSDASAHGGCHGAVIDISAAAAAWEWEADIGTNNYYNEEVVSSFGIMDDVVGFNKLADLENGLYFDENGFL